MIHFRSSTNNAWSRSGRGHIWFIKILCQGDQYLQLPKGDEHTYSFKNVTCHECLKRLIDMKVREASYCKEMIGFSEYQKPAGFKFKKNDRPRKVLHKIDPEILARI